jgi:hypothetical protein
MAHNNFNFTCRMGIFAMKDQKELDVQRVIDMNYRGLMLLGYSASLMHGVFDNRSAQEKKKYKWLIQCIDNMIYFDKPLPPCP